MEEEQGEDSEVLDAMDGWDSEEENTGTIASTEAGTVIEAGPKAVEPVKT